MTEKTPKNNQEQIEQLTSDLKNKKSWLKTTEKEIEEIQSEKVYELLDRFADMLRGKIDEIENKILELGGEIPEDENGEEEIKY
jgi:predicted RNA-binding protein with EMAP domain